MVIVYRKPCYQDFNVQRYLNNSQTWFENKLAPPPQHEFLALKIRIYNFFKTSMMLKYTFIFSLYLFEIVLENLVIKWLLIYK